jgi:hypothetical protein
LSALGLAERLASKLFLSRFFGKVIGTPFRSIKITTPEAELARFMFDSDSMKPKGFENG